MAFELAAAFIAIVAGLVLCFRLMRRGITTLDKDRAKYLEQIRDQQTHIEEDLRGISFRDNMQVARAAAEDILRLADAPEGSGVEVQGARLEVEIPAGRWTIALDQPSQALRRTGKVLQGRPEWTVSGPGGEHSFTDIGELMRHLDARVREALGKTAPPEPRDGDRPARDEGVPAPSAGTGRGGSAPESGPVLWPEDEDLRFWGQGSGDSPPDQGKDP
ncbi:MAG: translation initiation factor IF-2 [Desulfovibrio sp.]|jgi:hypothetical protein|nr:translation initiation factor IF-2 [Desulfovibrio sp.]